MDDLMPIKSMAELEAQVGDAVATVETGLCDLSSNMLILQ